MRAHGLQHHSSILRISQSLLKLMPIESVMPSNHLTLCCPLLLLLSVFPSNRVCFYLNPPKTWKVQPFRTFSVSVPETLLLQFYRTCRQDSGRMKAKRSTPSPTPLQDLDNVLQIENDTNAHQKGSPTLLSLQIKGIPVTLGVSRRLEGKDASHSNMRKKSLCKPERKNIIRLEMRLSSPTIYVRS